MGFPWKNTSKILKRSIDSCKSKLNQLKNDYDYSQKTKSKERKYKKVTPEIINWVKNSLKNDCPSKTVLWRYNKLLEKLKKLNITPERIYWLIRIQN